MGRAGGAEGAGLSRPSGPNRAAPRRRPSGAEGRSSELRVRASEDRVRALEPRDRPSEPRARAPTGGLAHPLVCCSLVETNRFPIFCLTSAGSRPGGRPTSLRRQRSGQERRHRRTGRLLRSRLPCAAHNRRPAQNSRAAPAQTAAPEGPAGFCAARRLGRGFPESPSVSARAGVIDGKAGGLFCSLLTQGLPVKARCLLKAPLSRRAAQQRAGPSGAAV